MRNRPYGFEIYLVNVKTIRTIMQIFVAFSEKLNFTGTKMRGLGVAVVKKHASSEIMSSGCELMAASSAATGAIVSHHTNYHT